MGRGIKKKGPDKREDKAQSWPSHETEPRPRTMWTRHFSLSLLVFSAGAILMSLEIAGSRVLASHFGSSVFVWGSLISVFLIALSVGYYVGGRIADRHPSRILLNLICIAVSLLIFAIAFVSYDICAWLAARGLGEQAGPFVASMVLFLPPSVGLGIVSPFAVRLATESIGTVGTVSGRMYALSTIGSIVGTLLTTFVLVPLIGLSAILKSLAVVALLVAILTSPFRRRVESAVGAAILVLLAFTSIPQSPRTPLQPDDVIAVDCDTPYHHISVIDNQGQRQLRFDRHVQSTIETAAPYASLNGYTYYFHLPFLVQPKIKRTLFIGAGGGVGPRAFHMHDRDMLIDLVDIDPKVLEIARSHFFLENAAEIRTFAEDGRMFLRKAEQRYGCVILDAFSIGGRIPFHLVTTEFLTLCRDKMTADGVFVMNINSAIEGPLARIFRSTYSTTEAVFPNTYVFAVNHRNHGLHESTNILLVATKSDQRISPEQWSVRAARYVSDCYVTRDQMQYMVGDLLADPPQVTDDIAFTDDYAPIETMSFRKPGQ